MKTRFLMILGIAILVTSSVVSVPNSVDALSCAISPFTESFVEHDLLLHGTLVEKQPSNQSGLGGQLTTLTFDAIKVYKGEQRDTFTIMADLTFDDFYRVGGDYVLFVDKHGDGYLRDLCVPDYVPTKKMIDFLDDYLSNPLIGIGVNQLYDVVGFPEMYSLDIKKQNYIELNRGDMILEQIRQEGLKNNYLCDFAKDLEKSSEYLSNNGFVTYFIEENLDYEEVGGAINLNTNPQIAKIVYMGDAEILEVSVMNAEIIGNCFFVYNVKFIDKNTNEVQRNLDSQERICMAENSHELFPDFCPNIVQKLPSFSEDVSLEINYGHQWILKIILIIVVIIGIFFGVRVWRKRK